MIQSREDGEYRRAVYCIGGIRQEDREGKPRSILLGHEVVGEMDVGIREVVERVLFRSIESADDVVSCGTPIGGILARNQRGTRSRIAERRPTVWNREQGSLA